MDVARSATPTLDALAASGTVFDSAHCQGSMQPAVCVPSRASLMTGRNIFASSQNPSADDYCGGPYDGPAFAIPPELPTFPQRCGRTAITPTQSENGTMTEHRLRVRFRPVKG
jgi:arylsulfatase A-like enzyme